MHEDDFVGGNVKAITLGLVLLSISNVTLAHHSEASYDAESVAAFQGTVTEFAWRNPHAYIMVETTTPEGTRIEWRVETGATPLLVRSGWTRESLTPGDRVSVRGSPARDGRREALLLTLEKADGTVLEQTIADSSATGSTADLAGVWKGTLASSERLFQQSWHLTEKGVLAQEQFDIFTENPAAACIGEPTPAIVLLTNAFLTEIELDEDVIMIRNERFDAERTIFMDGRGHPDEIERTIQGHSIGSWDGDVLVVDTTNFADHRNPLLMGVPSGAQKHVVERYQLNEEGTGLQVDFILEDPEYFAEPFSGSLDWVYRPDLELLRYDCDQEVASRYAEQ